MGDRPETGVIKFGKDWEAVLIRGDSAFAFSKSLKKILSKLVKSKSLDYDRKIVEDLAGLLESSNVHSKLYYAEYVQKCKPWKECVDEESV